MPYGSTVAAVVGAVVGVAGAVEQRKQTKKAEKKAEQADQLQLAQQRLQSARARRKQMAQMREAQAANIAAAEASGGGDSSAEAGALSSLATQAGSNIGFAKALEGADAGRFSVMQDMRKAQGKAATAGQVSQIGFSVAKGAVNQSPGGFSGMVDRAKDKVTSAFE